MSDENRLHFSNWLRQGMAASLIASNSPITQQSKQARFPVQLSVAVVDNGSERTELVSTEVQLYGPGDVAGIDRRQIKRTEPEHGTANFEPNYFAAIEFERADLPWMLTPTGSPADAGLTPWINLIVVEAEGAELQRSSNQTLPILTIEHPAGQLPRLEEAGFWSHVQCSLLATESDPSTPAELADLIQAEPERVQARLICPRRLAPNTQYLAALVPTFKSGVQAGLGQALGDESTLEFAWGQNPPDDLQLPVYFSWEFATGMAGDFESLAALLQPRVPPDTLGTRAMAINQPGYGMNEQLESSLPFESALHSPAFQRNDWNQPQRREQLQNLLNQPDDAQEPIVAPPIYGQWPAATFRVSTTAAPSGWLNELNLDPRHRAAAGLGTVTVQRHQEVLMQEAWRQSGQLEQANFLLYLGQLGRQLGGIIFNRSITKLPPGRQLQITRPMHRRVKVRNRSAHQYLASTRLPNGVFERRFRRLVSSRSVLGRRATRLNPGETRPFAHHYFDALASGSMRIGAKRSQAGLATLNTLLAESLDHFQPGSKARIVAERQLEKQFPDFRPSAIKRLKPAKPLRLVAGSTPLHEFNATSDPEGEDSRIFRDEAALTLTSLFELRGPESDKRKPVLPVKSVATELVKQVDPEITIVNRVRQRLEISSNLPATSSDPLQVIMAAPEFSGGMNQALQDLSEDFLLGEVRELRPNNMTLLENNAEFIESYLVGLNHEMARELLWRGYPTDQRGTYFPYFWRSAPLEATPAERAQYRDIPPIHTWERDSRLGSHLQFADGNLILLIRGELLRRYPVTMVTAVKCEWTTGDRDGLQLQRVRENGGEIRNGKFRRPIEDGQPGHQQLPPRFVTRMPPDISLYGFELTDTQARGSVNDEGEPDPNGDAGWFFVLTEPPGSTRFGFDESENPASSIPSNANDLDWQHLMQDRRGPLSVTEDAIAPGQQFHDGEAAADRDQLIWGSSSSHIAAICLQKPVMVAIHADDMLPKVE